MLKILIRLLKDVIAMKNRVGKLDIDNLQNVLSSLKKLKSHSYTQK